MKKTGLEIVEMIARGEAPKKIKINNNTYEFQKEFLFYQDEDMKCIDLIKCLNDEFEIIEEEKVWKPKKEEDYWYITDDGKIRRAEWVNSNLDEARYEIGNCFRTEEEANKALEKINIYMKLKRYAEEHNTEKLDFTSTNNSKWCIACGTNEIAPTGTYIVREIGQIYFTSKELCKQAIQEIGEDNIKKLFE